MKEFLWKHFVKDYENYTDPEVRGRYTRLTGTMGITVNTVLCIIKIILGVIINSIAVIADGAHDMADSLAAFITLIGAKISRQMRIIPTATPGQSTSRVLRCLSSYCSWATNS